ncbi:MAG: Fic family protein [archaeon]
MVEINNLEDLNVEKVMKVNKIINEKYDTTYGLLSRGNLHFCINKNSPYEISKNIIEKHPFIDGNKRTALVIYLLLTSDKKLEKIIKDYDLVLKNLI